MAGRLLWSCRQIPVTRDGVCHPRTISGCFVGYVEKSKGYRFYYPHHSLTFVELGNAKFLENDFASGSDLSFQREQPSTFGERLVIIQNIPHIQMGVVQPVNEDP